MMEVKLIKMKDSVISDFYNMKQLDDKFLEVTWGAYGTEGRKQKYPMTDWKKLLSSRLVRGFQDVTKNDKIVKIGTTASTHTLKPAIKELIEQLNHHADDAFKINYTVEITDVSEILVIEAQELIDKLRNDIKVGAMAATLNMSLLKLYKKVPRRIKNLNDALFPGNLNTDKEVDEALDKMDVEQGLLDVVKSKMDTGVASTSTGGGKHTVLDSLGLDIEEVTDAEKDMLLSMLDESKHRFVKAFKVTCFETQGKFDAEIKKAKTKKTKLLFHGSRSENWLGILKHGLKLHSGQYSIGKLFNNGIYFADIADKSLGYINGGRWSSFSGSTVNKWLAVFDVHLGKEANYNALKKANPNMSDWDIRNIDLAVFCKDNGYDSYFANKNMERRYSLVRNEFIVYDENKCTIKYLIEVK